MADLGFIRWFVGKVCKLSPRASGRIEVDRNMPVTMRDGVNLFADRYFTKGGELSPVVLIRSPYGRGAIFGMMAALIAERGFQTIIQSVRGTSGSGGKFDPMRQEQADGVDTLDWVRAQPWFSGKLFAFGGSYLGNTIWAMASKAPEKLDGLALSVTLSNFRDEILGFGGLTQAGTLSWTQTELMMTQPDQKMKRPKPGSLDHAHGHLPVGTIDQAAFGQTVSWWQDWVAHEDPGDPWWQPIDHSASVAALNAPTAMVGGWQDIFLPFQLKDFEARQAAGQETWLTIGPWGHASPGGMIENLRQGITLFSALSNGSDLFPGRDRVRLFLQGAGLWREYPSWPPPNSQPLCLHLRSKGKLSTTPAESAEVSTQYVYDPADPTPAVHGPMVMGGGKDRDMSSLEQRKDTILFTADVFDRDVDVIGPVRAELSVRSSRDHTDFFVSLCDVDNKGKSQLVCDGYLRLRPGKLASDDSGIRRITIECWPTAYRFKRGHKLRLIVASGAHPRYARNLGTGEPMATATKMVAARQEIFHSQAFGSSLHLLELRE